MSKARIMETIISIAGEISPTLGKTIDSVNKKLGGINDMAIVAGAAVASIGSAAVKSTKYLAELGTDYQKAVNDVAATTGLAGKQLEGLKDSVKEVYGSNFGESMGDVADGVSEVYRQMKLSGDELTNTTKAAYMLSDTFEYDIAESARAAKALMSNFGIGGEEAMGLIAAGAQNGLDYSGELLDSISEYSVQFSKLGFSADDMFQIFQQGADNGAWNLDKVGDAIKEFSIRSIDGSKSTTKAFKKLGLNSDKMMATFAKGGEEAEKAFQVVLDKLLKTKDKVKRDELGVALFGTQWEDLGVDAVKALSKAKDAAYDTKGALGQINKVKYNDLDSAMEGIKRKCEVALLPAAESVQNAFVDLAPKIEGMIDKVAPYITEFAEKIGPAITDAFEGMEKGLQWILDNGETVIPIIAGIGAAFATWKIGQFVSDAGGFVKALGKIKGALVAKLGGGLAFLSNPIFWIALAIGAVVAAGVWVIRNWDLVKEKAKELGAWLSKTWEGLKTKTVQVWTNVASKISEKWAEIKQKCSDSINGVKTYLSNGWANIKNTVSTWWSNIVSTISTKWAEIKSKCVNTVSQLANSLSTWWTNIKNTAVNKFTEVKNGLANKWTEIKTSISEFIEAIKTKIADGFAEAKEKMLAPFTAVANKIDEVKGKISGVVDKAKNFSLSDTLASWGVPGFAKGGFTRGLSFAGEAGTEAVISFDPAYRADNLKYWAQAGRMLGVDPGYALTGVSNSSYVDLGGVTFAPNVVINGNANKQDVLEAIREAYPEFLDMLDELLAEREVTVYA